MALNQNHDLIRLGLQAYPVAPIMNLYINHFEFKE